MAAPIALPSAAHGRAWLEERPRVDTEDPGRAIRREAQRDRDRILYSSAFQRLGFVTQVSAPEAGRVFHTRLTHSLKVAQFARRLAERLVAQLPAHGEVARALGLLDPDAVEAASLAHDLGHPPFGHLAETVLDTLGGNEGGIRFEGNAQSFRIITRLALRSHSDEGGGLDLTRQTLNGTLKYPWLYDGADKVRSKKWGAFDEDRRRFAWARQGLSDGRTLDAHIMNWADDVTYAVHDLDDFFRAGLLPLAELSDPQGGELERFRDYLEQHRDDRGYDSDSMIGSLQELFLEGLVPDYGYRGSKENRVTLREGGSDLITRFISAVDVTEREGRAVFEIDALRSSEVEVLKALTWRYVIDRPELAAIQKGQRTVIEDLFRWYSEAADKEPHVFHESAAEDLRGATKHTQVRVAIDLIAGLTEPAAYAIHARISGRTRGALVGAPTPGT